MSRSLSRWQALLLGLVVLISLGMGGLGLFVVGSQTWPGRNDLHVLVGFPEILGVEVGTRVRIQGVDAGEVVRVVAPREPDELVILRLRIKGDYRHLVRSSSLVQIVPEGMLGGKVLEIRPPVSRSGQPPPDLSPADEDCLLAGETPPTLNDLLTQIGQTMRGVENGQGTLGKLVKDPQAYEALVGLLRSSNDAVERSKDAIQTIQRDADALKKVPVLGGYIEDPVGLLVRPACEKHRRLFAEADLFEPGRAVLTAEGRERLDELAAWLTEWKLKGSEVVVVSYARPQSVEARVAINVTRQQSEAVAAYLKSSQKIHRMGWFGSRRVTALGMGTQLPPQAEREELPPARTEVVVFIPQN
ncbi:MAG: MlaD family protein [Gemmataceae bacterium]